MPLYFAYGSNLSRVQMQERCPGARPLATASIPHHRLGFVGHSEAWGGGTSTIVLAVEDTLWGALYEVEPACLEVLGRHEGSDYTLCRTQVIREGGAREHALVFVRARDFDERPPSERYVSVIRRGYADWKLPTDAFDRAVDRARGGGVDSARRTG
jgi:gamma-glutamylcyclotransferase (GGCT)/AIG2-like uncharacterized protein YtfP